MATTAIKKLWQQEVERYAKSDIKPSDQPVLSFREFVDRTYPRYQWYRHCIVLADALQKVVDGDLKRLMVFMPPRSGKSLLTSKLFPGYCLYRHPDKWAGIASYGAELAYTLSRSCRDVYLLTGGDCRDDAASVKHWETTKGGGLWAAGVGGAATGKGYYWGLIDDPLKNAEESSSELIRRKHQEWYESVFYTRAEPDAAIVVIQTRWNADDLSGWLLKQEAESPEHWHVINFAAIAEENPMIFPASCTVEPDWRNPGEALCPERFSLERLQKIKSKVGSYFWSSLYQQRPSPEEGGQFKRQWWEFYSQPPAQFDQIIQSWDCAFKETKSSDFVVGQCWGKKGGEFYLLDQVRGRMDINATLTAIRSLSAKYPNSRAKLVEDKANGSAVIDLLKREIPGLIPVEPQGGKVVRAIAVSPYVEAGNVYLPEPSKAWWVHDFIEEFAAFPNGSNDDQVDALSQALIWLDKNKPASWGASQASYS